MSYKKKYSIIFIGLLFSSIANLPDLLPIFKDIYSWQPVKSFPHALSDDYFYFGYLNKISQNNLSVPRDFFYDYEPLSQEYAKILLYWINSLFFSLGSFFFDTRFGVFFVRFFNAFFLFVSMSYFFKTLFRVTKTRSNLLTISLLCFSCFFFFKLLEPPYNYLFDFKNQFSESIIYKRGDFNNLTRAFYAGSSGVLIFFSFGNIIKLYNRPDKKYKYFLIPFFWIIAFSLIHIPTTVVIFIFTLILSINKFKIKLIKEHGFKALSLVVILISIVLFQKFFILSSTVMVKEVINTSIDFSLRFKSLDITTRLITLLLLVATPFLPPAFFYITLKKRIPENIYLIYFIIAIFSIGCVFENTFLNRFWHRSSIIPYTALTFFLFFNFIKVYVFPLFPQKLNRFLTMFLLIFVFFFMTVFFYRNANYLEKNFSRRTKYPELLSYIINSEKENPILTNSIETIDMVNCFSNKDLMFQDFSFQPKGYKQNINRTVANFKLLGTTKKQFQNTLHENPFSSVNNLSSLRPLNLDSKETFKKAYLYAFYMKTSYYYLNLKLLNHNKKRIFKRNEDSFYFAAEEAFEKQLKEKILRNNFDIVIEKVAEQVIPIKTNKFSYLGKIELDSGQIVIYKDVMFKK